ncbi:hypothetical protein BpHYR1_031960 [Brachionus plicatilis]|uniref:Uncharacterized protein n=1 Tax=Brachionus plicatilis TaxID=10195 RepID=A0A3M7S3M9_BRAPC|nr:hypothetical protein BpHYR1_031960 [Brachionus plicatilis]
MCSIDFLRGADYFTLKNNYSVHFLQRAFFKTVTALIHALLKYNNFRLDEITVGQIIDIYQKNNFLQELIKKIGKFCMEKPKKKEPKSSHIIEFSKIDYDFLRETHPNIKLQAAY